MTPAALLVSLSAALAGLLRFGPLPAVEVAPGGEVSVPLEEYIVADSPVERIDAVAPADLPVRTLGGLWLVAGPAPGRGIHPVTIDLRTAGGERAEATLVVAVAEPPERDVVLRYRPPGDEPIARVVAAGEWNGWSQEATPLAPVGDAWEARLRLPPGRYAYKFVVDGRWTPDPANPNRAPDGFGGENTILVVEAEAPPPRLIPRRLEAGRAVLEFAGDLDPGAVAALVDEEPAAVEVSGNRIAVVLPSGARVVRVFAADRGRRLARFRFDLAERTWRDAILYYAVIDRFANGDTANDRPVRAEGLTPQANWAGGDIAGLRAKVEEGYFDRLGVDAIWISPHLEAPDGAYRDALPPHRLFTGYHGYWPVDSRRVEERFGTVDDLRDLVEAARARGIRILLDMVYTHVHEEHPLRAARPDLFVPVELPDGRRNIRLFDEFPMTTWFDEFLPKIDYERDEAVEWAMDVTRYWLDLGVDGFRLDAVKHIPHRFWRRLRLEIARHEARTGRPFWTVGETIDSRERISSFVRPSMLDGQFDFPLYWSIREALARGTEGLDRVEAEIARSEREYPEGAIMSPLIGNHDVSRFATYADGDLAPGTDEKAAAWGLPVTVDSPAAYERLKTAFTLLMGLDGVPMIYYGDEIGMAGAHDPDNRRMMRFGGAVTDAERGVLEHVARATAARRAHPALRRGARRPLLAGAERLAFLKTYFGDAALVAIRRGGGDGAFDLEVAPDLPDGTILVDALGSGLAATVEGGRIRFELPPLSSAILVGAGGPAGGG